MKKKEPVEESKLTLAKIPIQDTRLFYENYTNHENLNSLIMGEIEELKKQDPQGMPGANNGCWRSAAKYKCETELFKAFSLMLSGWCDHYFPKQPMDASIVYWTNINEPGSANLFHSHYRADADVSGVYYVQGKDTGVIRFATHEQMNKMIRPGQPYSNMIGHAPREGDLLMFPSYLLHDVEVNRSNRQRISIAFNATFTAKVKDNVINLPNNIKETK